METSTSSNNDQSFEHQHELEGDGAEYTEVVVINQDNNEEVGACISRATTAQHIEIMTDDYINQEQSHENIVGSFLLNVNR